MADGDVSLRYRLLGSDEGASRAFDKVGKSSDHLSTKMVAVGSAIGGLAASGVMALGSMAAGAVKTGLTTAASMQQAQIAFTTLLGSEQAAGTYLKDLQEFAAHTPFEMQGLVESSRSLLGVGVSAGEAKAILRDFGDAAAAVGIDQAHFQGVMIATSQAIGNGRFMTADLNQIANNGIPIWKILSDAMGVPPVKLREMASSGQLLAKDVMPLLHTEMHKDFGGSLEAQSRTLTGVWSNLMDTITQGLGNALAPLATWLQNVLPGAIDTLGKAFAAIPAATSGFTAWLGQIRGQMEKAFGDPKTTADVNALRATVAKAFSQIWAAVGPALRQIWQTIQTQVVPAWVAFEKALIPVVNYFVKTLAPTVKATMAAVLSAVDGVLKIIAGLLNVFAGILSGDWSRAWAGVKQITRGAVQAVVGIIRGLISAVTGLLSSAVGALRKLGSNIMQGLLHGIEAGASAIYDKIAGIASGIKDKFASVLHIFSPSRVMMKLGRDVINGVTEGLKQAAPQTYATIEAFAKRIGAMKVTAGIRDDVAESVRTFGPGLQHVGAQLDVLTDKVKNQQQAYDDLVKTRDDYAKQLSQGINGGGSIAGIGLAKDEVDSDGNVTKKADVVGEFVKSLQAKADAITQFGDKVNDLRAEGLSEAVIQQIQQAGLETGGALASALATATPEAVKSINALSDRVTAQSNAMGKAWADDMYQSGIDAAKGLLEGLKSQESHLMWAIRTIAQNMVNEIKKTLKIKSPSGVMADEVGAMIPAGLIAGINGGAGGVASAMRSLVAIPSGGARIGLGGSIAGAAGGDTHVHLHVPNGFVGSPDQLATALSDVISRAKARGLNLSFA